MMKYDIHMLPLLYLSCTFVTSGFTVYSQLMALLYISNKKLYSLFPANVSPAYSQLMALLYVLN